MLVSTTSTGSLFQREGAATQNARLARSVRVLGTIRHQTYDIVCYCQKTAGTSSTAWVVRWNMDSHKPQWSCRCATSGPQCEIWWTDSHRLLHVTCNKTIVSVTSSEETLYMHWNSAYQSPDGLCILHFGWLIFLRPSSIKISTFWIETETYTHTNRDKQALIVQCSWLLSADQQNVGSLKLLSWLHTVQKIFLQVNWQKVHKFRS